MSTRQHEAIPRPFDSARGIPISISTNDQLRTIYELEALIHQALDILMQVDSAVKALKPPPAPRKKMTKEQVIKSFRMACKDSQRNNIKCK